MTRILQGKKIFTKVTLYNYVQLLICLPAYLLLHSFFAYFIYKIHQIRKTHRKSLIIEEKYFLKIYWFNTK